jgi:hypothetical protein
MLSALTRGTIVSFNASNWTALVLLDGSLAEVEMPVLESVPSSQLAADDQVAVLLFQATNFENGVILGAFGAAGPADSAGTWTPTVTQSGSVAVTVNSARYRIQGKLCHVQARLTITGSGTAGNGIIIGGQPSAIQAVSSEIIIGHFLLLDAGTAYYIGAIRAVTATNWQFFAHLEASSVGADPSFALAPGDVIYFAGTYELA